MFQRQSPEGSQQINMGVWKVHNQPMRRPHLDFITHQSVDDNGYVSSFLQSLNLSRTQMVGASVVLGAKRAI